MLHVRSQVDRRDRIVAAEADVGEVGAAAVRDDHGQAVVREGGLLSRGLAPPNATEQRVRLVTQFVEGGAQEGVLFEAVAASACDERSE